MSIIIGAIALSQIQMILAIGGVAALGAFTLPPLYRFAKSKMGNFKLPQVLGRAKERSAVS